MPVVDAVSSSDDSAHTAGIATRSGVNVLTARHGPSQSQRRVVTIRFVRQATRADVVFVVVCSGESAAGSSERVSVEADVISRPYDELCCEAATFARRWLALVAIHALASVATNELRAL